MLSRRSRRHRSLLCEGCDCLVRHRPSAWVVAATKDGTGSPAVEIGDGGEKAVATVTIPIAPCLDIAAPWHIVTGAKCFACEAVEDAEVFRTVEDAPLPAVVVVAAPVFVWVAYDFSFAVYGAVGGLHHDFGPSGAVEVIDEELCIMGASPDVLP